MILALDRRTWRSWRWSKEEASPLDEELSVVGGVEDFFCFWEDGGDIRTTEEVTESEFPKSKIIISNVST